MTASQPRILIVDDEPWGRLSMRICLENAGYDALDEARDGVEALEKYEPDVTDLILLNVKMPRMNGHEVLAELRRRRAPVKVILHSSELGYLTDDPEKVLGATDRFKLPYRAGDLPSRVSTALDTGETVAELVDRSIIEKLVGLSAKTQFDPSKFTIAIISAHDAADDEASDAPSIPD